MLKAKKDFDDKADWWPCACVKRDKAGNMKAIKLNHPDLKRCLVCKCSTLDDDIPGTAKGKSDE